MHCPMLSMFVCDPQIIDNLNINFDHSHITNIVHKYYRYILWAKYIYNLKYKVYLCGIPISHWRIEKGVKGALALLPKIS